MSLRWTASLRLPLDCVTAIAVFILGQFAFVHAAPPAPALTTEEITKLGAEAYIYGYSLVMMEYNRRQLTNVVQPDESRAPMGQFTKMRTCPAPDNHLFNAPNADTLYNTCYLDVGKEPYVLSLPDTHGRYYLFPMLDAWTNVFADPGKRTTGTGPQQYAITGPGWHGSLPKGVVEYKSPTALVWIVGRIYCNGSPEDYRAVHEIQDKISIVPLSSYGKPYTPPPGVVDPSVDMKSVIRDQVAALSADQFFNLLASLMKESPPAPADAPMLSKLARIGIIPGQPFDSGKLGTAAAKALADVPQLASGQIGGWSKKGIASGDFRYQNGWVIPTKVGRYGTDYIQRALFSAVGLGANLLRDAAYASSEIDAQGKPYSGENKYVMRFPKGQLPPANGFWSLTLYTGEGFFYANAINRYCLGTRQMPKASPDGSATIYVQNENPGPDKESNWLPSPKGKFLFILRLYWPKEKSPSIINGTWTIPAIEKDTQ